MSNLAFFLNQLTTQYHKKEFLSSDPLEFVHHYHDPLDQEAVALIAAVLAYGNVKQIRKSIENALNRMNQISESPKDFVKQLRSQAYEKRAYRLFENYVHRFNQGADLVLLCSLLSQSWSQYGSLGSHFLSYLKPDDENIGPALSRLISQWHQESSSKKASTFSYFLTSPADGSCCKRWCMFLRWMGRKDDVDPGLWTKKGLRSNQLVIPLDTHTGRISQYLGLTSRKSLNWKAALEVTHALKKVDPVDPIRYDFALSRLGILDICQKKYRQEICEKCQLLSECRFAQKKVKITYDSSHRRRR